MGREMVAIPERVFDGNVAIYCDDTKVQNRSSTTGYITANPKPFHKSEINGIFKVRKFWNVSLTKNKYIFLKNNKKEFTDLSLSA